MDQRTQKRLSKFLSYVLRHRPDTIGVVLDDAGWLEVDRLLDACRQQGQAITRDQLDEIVAISPKQRFAFSQDGARIRASQGHSVDVALGYQATAPPELLFHGTVTRAIAEIQVGGLQRMKRHHVHLSADRETARVVGSRRGAPIVLVVRAGQMHRDGFEFFRSDNGVWLTEQVPAHYLEFPEPGGRADGGR